MNAAEILINHNLKRTSCREGIIDTIMTENQALSEKEVSDKLLANYDRVTIYRSFKTLEENNILHKIVIENQLVKYALNNSTTNKKEHAHFYCKKCKKVSCLNSISAISLELPKGYTEYETEVLIKGICKECNKHIRQND